MLPENLNREDAGSEAFEAQSGVGQEWPIVTGSRRNDSTTDSPRALRVLRSFALLRSRAILFVKKSSTAESTVKTQKAKVRCLQGRNRNVRE